jgi:hypothetical protein
MQGVRAYSSVDAVGSESGWHRRGRANGEGSTEAKKQPAVRVLVVHQIRGVVRRLVLVRLAR